MPDEQYSNNASTLLSAGVTSGSQTSIAIAAFTGFPGSAQYRILVEAELMLVTAGAGTTTWTVTRGVEGTAATTHPAGAVVTHILTAAAIKNIPDYPRKDLLTTKGDLYVATANATMARLAAGTNGQVLAADSGETTGLRWVTSPFEDSPVQTLASDQTLTSSETYTDITGCLVSLGAGKWLILGTAVIEINGSYGALFIADAANTILGQGAGAGSGLVLGMTAVAIVTVGSTTTHKLRAIADSTTSRVLARYTRIAAVRMT
jgi:hypothetical protein